MIRDIVLWELTPQVHAEGADAVTARLDASIRALVGKSSGTASY